MRCYRLGCYLINRDFNMKMRSKVGTKYFTRWNSSNSDIVPPESEVSGSKNENFDDVAPDLNKEGEYFRYLLRHSKFINMGDPEGKSVFGTVFHVVKDDLYIDFGWKFYCVCPRPYKNGDRYVRGSKVYLRLKDLELSSRFLGAEKDLTLLEADATLTGLAFSPIAPKDV